MEYTSFVKDAAHKRRSVKDLARFIATRTDNNPNYSLLFGAGCSISSGVRSATQLANLWRNELYLSCANTKADPKADADAQRTFLKTHEVTLPLLSVLHRLPIMRTSFLAAGPRTSVAQTSLG